MATGAPQPADVPGIHNAVRAFRYIRHSHFGHTRRQHSWLAAFGDDTHHRNPVRQFAARYQRPPTRHPKTVFRHHRSAGRARRAGEEPTGVTEELRPHTVGEMATQETRQCVVPGNPGYRSFGHGELLVNLEGSHWLGLVSAEAGWHGQSTQPGFNEPFHYWHGQASGLFSLLAGASYGGAESSRSTQRITHCHVLPPCKRL